MALQGYMSGSDTCRLPAEQVWLSPCAPGVQWRTEPRQGQSLDPQITAWSRAPLPSTHKQQQQTQDCHVSARNKSFIVLSICDLGIVTTDCLLKHHDGKRHQFIYKKQLKVYAQATETML